MIARVLIIEDNPDNLELMMYLLNQYGYKIFTAADGEKGLALARQEIPDLIICDIQLPTLDGYGVAKKLREDSRLMNIPIIAVTAYAMVGDRDRILAKGFDGYLGKPIEPETFVKQVEKFLQIRHRSHQIPSAIADTQQKTAVTLSPAPAITRGIILVVDDKFPDRELARVLLESVGFKILLASSVNDALEILKKKKPDLLLCDIRIPDLNGLDLLKTMKMNSELKSIPFVVISSYLQSENLLQECMKSGALRFIQRPVDAELFLKIIEEIWLSIQSPDQSAGNNQIK